MGAITIPSFTVDTDADATVMAALAAAVAAIEQRTIPTCKAINTALTNLEDLVIDIDISPDVQSGTDASQGNCGVSYGITAGGVGSWHLDAKIWLPAGMFTHDAGNWKRPKILGASVGAGVGAPDYYQTIVVGKRYSETDTYFIQRFHMLDPGGWGIQPFPSGVHFNFQALVRGLRKTQPI